MSDALVTPPSADSAANGSVTSDATRLAPVLPVASRSFTCCGGGTWLSKLLVVSCVACLVAVGAAIYLAGVAAEARRAAARTPLADIEDGVFDSAIDPATGLPVAFAAAAVRDNNYSIATGQVSEQAEGFFVLDHNSGLLQCLVLYPRTARFMASFSVNVGDALGVSGKGGQYLLTTGRVDFVRGSNSPAALSSVYVLDTATGNYACYGIPFDRVQMNASRPQQGLMVLLAAGSANPVVNRDELR